MTNVVFGPTTKNTEALANCVADGLKKSGAEVTLKNVISADINQLKEYDAIVFVCTLKGVGKPQDDSGILGHRSMPSEPNLPSSFAS
jgi:flavodoxin